MKSLIAVAVLAFAISGCAITREGPAAYSGASAAPSHSPYPKAADQGLF